MKNLNNVISESYNKKDVSVSEAEIRLASDGFIGFVDLLTKIRNRRDEELSKKSKSNESNFVKNDILEEI